MKKNALKNNRGMTLVEIMIVLAILGSIFALLLPRIAGSQDKAKVKEARIQMSQLISAIVTYENDCGKPPAGLSGLVAADSNCSNWGPEPYYKPKGKETTVKDPWGNEYVYEVQGGAYTLKSLGKDGAEGGSGYAADINSADL